MALENVDILLIKGIEEYKGIKEIEDISRMTLIPFISSKTQGPINIEDTCRLIRCEMKS